MSFWSSTLIKCVPLPTSVMSSPTWYGLWGRRHGGNSGLVGIMEVMAILLDAGTESLETTMGTVGVGWRSMGSAMMGHCWHQVAWSDQIDCFNLRMGLGLARLSISKYEGSSNTDLRASGSDMMIKGYVLKAVWMMIVGWKMEIYGRIGSWCLNMGINVESEVERYSMLNWCVITGCMISPQLPTCLHLQVWCFTSLLMLAHAPTMADQAGCDHRWHATCRLLHGFWEPFFPMDLVYFHGTGHLGHH